MSLSHMEKLVENYYKTHKSNQPCFCKKCEKNWTKLAEKALRSNYASRSE